MLGLQIRKLPRQAHPLPHLLRLRDPAGVQEELHEANLGPCPERAQGGLGGSFHGGHSVDALTQRLFEGWKPRVIRDAHRNRQQRFKRHEYRALQSTHGLPSLVAVGPRRAKVLANPRERRRDVGLALLLEGGIDCACRHGVVAGEIEIDHREPRVRDGGAEPSSRQQPAACEKSQSKPYT
ncbi:hypothetical protein TBR22_A18860 [Luteitalea sp. TBR-22]|nr:hypothetical protein TBR22_A18860 [Luteitalea sp. TBR-22]